MAKRTLYVAAAVLAVTSAIGAGVYASQSHDSAAAAIAAARIDLVQAILTAEKHIGGRAVSAELERDKAQLLYEVEVVRDATVMEVKIDAETGNVISAVEEKDD